MTVLLVDDSTIIRRVIKNVLVKKLDKPTILEAADGQEAMEALENNEVDLMFLDWNMPIMTGEEVVNKVRGEFKDKYKALRIIMATTEGGKGNVIKMIKKGVNGYLVKPFTEESITKTLEQVTARMR